MERQREHYTFYVKDRKEVFAVKMVDRRKMEKQGIGTACSMGPRIHSRSRSLAVNLGNSLLQSPDRK